MWFGVRGLAGVCSPEVGIEAAWSWVPSGGGRSVAGIGDSWS